jgi:hypothetical protein
MIILFTTIIFNLYYFIKFKKMGVYNKKKNDLLYMINHVKNIQDMFDLQKTLIPNYYNDPLFGALNWFSTTLITYLRTFYLNLEKHSKNCYEYARIIKDVIDKSDLGETYFKTELVSLLSYKPFIKYNHVITLAYRKSSTNKTVVDVFSPYDLIETVLEEDLKSKLYKIMEKYFEKDNVKYIPYYLRILF